MNTQPIKLKLRHNIGYSSYTTETDLHHTTHRSYSYYEFNDSIRAETNLLGEHKTNCRISCPHCSDARIHPNQCTVLVIKGSEIKKTSVRLKYDTYYSYLFGLHRWIFQYFAITILFLILAFVFDYLNIDFPLAILTEDTDEWINAIYAFIDFFIYLLILRTVLSILFFVRYNNRNFSIYLPKLQVIRNPQLDFYNIITEVNGSGDHELDDSLKNHNFSLDQYPFLNKTFELKVNTRVV